MIASLLAVMLSSTPTPITFDLPKPPPRRCTEACAERFRLPASSDDSAAIKYRALAEDGTDCNVTRSKICRQKPRTWLRTSY